MRCLYDNNHYTQLSAVGYNVEDKARVREHKYTQPEVGDEFKSPFSELNSQHPVSH